MRNITKAPAIAKEDTSTPNRCKIDSPPKRKANINKAEESVAFPGSMILPCSFMPMMTGRFPKISMIEKRI